ncbi:MAG: SGNH/GDSL hydrolase family protein [Thermodesulfobacteriota bacterium]|nr:SGNH/GDSL hydrolase family protein [Thermodesulfobacteriota bacterium]
MELTKVLFIGNSYTYFNNLPFMLENLSSAVGKAVQAQSVTRGRKTLQWHWHNPQTLDILDQGHWDFVVLQEQSTRPVNEPEQMRRAVARFASRIQKSGGTPLLYLTWARQRIPEMQDALTKTYLSITQEFDAWIAPVGPAWAKALADSPELTLHAEDESHPNILGSYLAACVFYAVLFRETPMRLPAQFRLSPDVTVIIDTSRARFLQEVAWSTCRDAWDAYSKADTDKA